MKQTTVYKVFIASPGDLKEEREIFPKIIDHINDLRKNSPYNCVLEAVGWEDTLPGFGRPQGLINKDVEECDVFVMSLWKHWGLDSGKFSSGTEEEFHIARKRFDESGEPNMLAYFRSVPEDMMADPGAELQKVINFRNKIETEKICLYKGYDTPGDWKDLLVKHLNQWLDKKVHGEGFGTAREERKVEIPQDVKEKIQGLEEEAKKKADELDTAQTKLYKEALVCAEKALKHSESGEFTLAEEMFSKSLSLYEMPAVLNSFGLFLKQIGSLDRAKEKFERILSVTEDLEAKAIALGNLANLYHTLGDLDKAEEMFEKSLAMNEKLGRKKGMANQYGNLGVLYSTRGDHVKAEEMHKKSLAINEKLGRKKGIAANYGNLGILYHGRRDLDRAEEMFEKSLAINEGLGRKEGMANQYGNLGILYQTRENLEKAEEM